VKGILLAGGRGTRLYPITLGLSKHLLPVYDKPMIYYPLSVLMLAGVRDVLLIGTARDLPVFHRIFGDGSHLGVRISYAEQPHADGIAQALVIGADFVGQDQVALILGDNIFHGPGLSHILRCSVRELHGATLFGYSVADPSRFAVAEIDAGGWLLSIEEKPRSPRSSIAVTGLYLYDNDVLDVARALRRSSRGELEITDVNRAFLQAGRAKVTMLSRGHAWLDAGTHESLLEASEFVRVLERRQGIRIACLEEVALRMGYIDREQCDRLGARMAGSSYGHYVRSVAATLSEDDGVEPLPGQIARDPRRAVPPASVMSPPRAPCRAARSCRT
jgi:glucose-1-phosphate thymidylyltransferase